MKNQDIPGYSYGTSGVAKSEVPVHDLASLMISLGFTKLDEFYLRLAGGVLADQVAQVVDHWRSRIIVSIPNLARHSRTLDGQAIPEYLKRSNARFCQWILDTCMRPYDQDWINYQEEIALRHTSFRKNKTDEVESSTYVPMRDVIAFTSVMNETIKPYLAAKGHTVDEVEHMHTAWCKAIQLQMTLWVGPYADNQRAPRQW